MLQILTVIIYRCKWQDLYDLFTDNTVRRGKQMGYFVVRNRFERLRNQFLLQHDNWNDFWLYETLYSLYFFDQNGQKHFLGYVKIADDELNEGSDRLLPDLPETFDTLETRFFSVGQDSDYYKNIYNSLDELPIDPFLALNDMAYDLSLLDLHMNRDVVKNSLLRNVSVTMIKRQFNRICHGGAVLTDYQFTYVYDKDSSDLNAGQNNMNFDVMVDSTPPTNIHVLIGGNGVGKSKLFHHMISLYLDNDQEHAYFLNENEEKTHPSEIFPNLIYMSYSAFDNCENVQDHNEKQDGKRYTYLGLRKLKANNDKNESAKYENKNLDDLANEFVDSLFNCKGSKAKMERLKKALEILESDPIFKQAQIHEIINDDITEEEKNNKRIFYKTKLGSGHGIILLIITKLVETLEEKTLVLLDEPETHLHPPLVSSFIRCLSELLMSTNAVAIIATHSPIILQEVPKNCVWILNRSGCHCSISRPRFETFGESYNSLVEEVFGLEIQKSGFHKMIADEVEKLSSYDELIEKFDNQLGTDADIVARTLFLQKENKNEN